MKVSMKMKLYRVIVLLVAAASLLIAARVGADRTVYASATLVTKTWDGGGATNNWSEAANWSDDIVPAAGDDVIFDATSVKNATIDTSINVGSIAIGSGYAGTITQSDSASIAINGCSGRPCFLQSGGTFNGGEATITLNSAGFGAFRMLGGTFNGGSGDMNLPNGPSFGADFLLQGGTFTSTSGNLTIAGLFRYQNPGTMFLHHNGTVTLAAVQPQFFSNDSNHPTITFHDLNIDSAPGINYDFGPRVIVEGMLELNDGTIGQGNNGSVIEARGGFSVSPNFDGGIGKVEFGTAGAPRTITLVAGLTYPNIRLNDPEVTVDASGTGTLVMPHQLNINQGTFNQGGVDMTINSLGVSGGPCLVMSGGTFNGGSGAITLNSDGFGTIFMTDGTFNGGSGDITATGSAPPQTNHDIQVNGGIFKSTSGTLFVSRAFRFQNGGIFRHNGGTVAFNGATTTSIVSDDGMGNSPPLIFNNLIYNRDNNTMLQLLANRLIINGTLSLTDGVIDDGGAFRTIEVHGDVDVASTFDGVTFRIKILFGGTACQTVTLNGAQNFPGAWEANNSGCGVTADGNFALGSLRSPNGEFNFAAGSHASIVGDMTIDPNGRVRLRDNSAVNVNGNVTIGGGLVLTGNDPSLTVGGAIDASGTGGDLTIDAGSVGAAIDVSGTGGDLTIDVEGVGGAIDVGTSGGDLTIVLAGSDNVYNAGAGQIGGSVEVSGSGNVLQFDSLTLEPGAGLTADLGNTLIFGGDIVNNGLVNLHGGGSACMPGMGPYVALQSTVAGVQRSWSGTGVFRMVNVNVSDMGGTAPIRAHNSLSAGGNNGANWIFDNECRANVLHTPFDFDGDSRTDVAIFRPSSLEWWLHRSTLGDIAVVTGSAADRPTPADFDGDGLTDIAVWREGDHSTFYIIESSTLTIRTEDFGTNGDDPKLVGDWDGDGKADPAVYRDGPAGGQSFIYYLGSLDNPNRNITFVPWGLGGDQPVRGDFDGDGRMDAAIFRPSDFNWWIAMSSNGQSVAQPWGALDDKRFEGDFDGDGKTDLAVFRPSETIWYILPSSNAPTIAIPFGNATDVLTPGDYDGDGRADISIWRPSNGQNWILPSSNGTPTQVTFGTTGDIPLASVFIQ